MDESIVFVKTDVAASFIFYYDQGGKLQAMLFRNIRKSGNWS